MEPQYNPKPIEAKWYKTWLDKKLFSCERPGEAYSLVIPPPNVTGALHMGHALNNTIQDVLSRKHRLEGKAVLWMPGTDHAGIATQNVVERKLKEEKKTRHDLGREKFVETVWAWKKEYHARISGQLQALGVSLDWDKERFTMDEGLSRAVRRVFVQLYKEGLIYKGKRIINWCPRCETALSDEEAVHEETSGHLWHIRYQVKGSKESIVVATTRPETMLGDAAVAVHPEDERYTNLHGKMLILPLANREIPLITDPLVEKEFGTGAVKVTPAHDPNDYEMGQRHGLPMSVIMDAKAKMTGDIPPQYQNLDRFVARKNIVADLEAGGFLVKTEDHRHSVGACQRCKTVVEPSLSPQWFVSMKPLAVPAIAAVKNGDIRFFPNRWVKVYLDWMENIRDWCISRQIWWGHRIPAWTCAQCGKIMVAEEAPKQCDACQSSNLEQDPDVLDTWFSSWLWPFSTMGWPDDTPTLRRFYPTAILTTASDIIFFWVARMIMAGFHFTGKAPFRDVCFHSIIRDASGKKMSKSSGNAMDPLQLVDQFGADAVRFSLMIVTAQGQDVYLNLEKFEIGRNFCNKLWNATRFVLGYMEGWQPAPGRDSGFALSDSDLDLADKWILHRLHSVEQEIEEHYKNYRFNEIAGALYNFVWEDYCSWYLELKKPILSNLAASPDQSYAARYLLRRVLVRVLQLLHPFIPYITEEIWSIIREKNPAELDEYLITSRPVDFSGAPVEARAFATFTFVQNVVVAIRNIRAEYKVPPGKKVRAVVQAEVPETQEMIRQQAGLIQLMGKAEGLEVSGRQEKPEGSVSQVVGGLEVFVFLADLVDLEKEREKKTAEIQRLNTLVENLELKLRNRDFLARAPEAIVNKEKEKLAGYRQTAEKLRQTIEGMR